MALIWDVTGNSISAKLAFDKDPLLLSEADMASKARITESKDWRTFLTMTASGKEEIKAWILSFGPKAEVLYPDWLREEVKRDIRCTLTNYKEVP